MPCVDPDVEPWEEAELMSALGRGDPAALDEVYEIWRPRLFAFLVRLCGSRELAADLQQETWLRLARSFASLREDTRIGAWLCTVGRNLFISHQRWALLDGDSINELSLWPGELGPRPGPFEDVAQSETERCLEAAIATLPSKYREVILLVGIEGMTPSEVAGILELRADAIRQRLRRARKLLARELQRDSVGLIAPAGLGG